MSSRILLVATTNKKKLLELQTLLKDLDLQLQCLADLKGFTPVKEDGKTFAENAAKKALGYSEQSGLLTLGEDSGLCCDALDGAPGVYSARFAGEETTDEANNQKLLRVLSNIPDHCRTAHYRSVIAIAEPGKLIGTAEGRVDGFILHEPNGTGGFGYDPLFYYPGLKTTFANMPADAKHQVSHRGKAFLSARNLLINYLQKK